MRFTVSNSSVPVGRYRCKFLGVEATTHVEYGEGMQWGFEIVEGEEKGRKTLRTTKCEATLKNSLGKFLASLKGEKPSAGLEIDPDNFVGKIFDVLVTESQSGESTRIDSFSPADDTPF